MHGSPKSKWDSRDLWKHYDYHQLGIDTEPYLDTDFSKVFYLTDTGRRWDGYKVSVRDKIPVFQEQWVEKGWVIRNKEEDKKARYDFEFLDKDGYPVTIQALSRMFNQEYWNYAKLISGILRHGMPIQNVVELITKLNFDVDSITTWSNGVARALKRYIKDGTETGEVCPDCGGKIVYSNGCKSCPNCGWSKCS